MILIGVTIADNYFVGRFFSNFNTASNFYSRLRYRSNFGESPGRAGGLPH